MIELKTPRGLSVSVPESPAEDPSPKFSAHDTSSIKAYYDLNGYVIVKNLFGSQDCDAIRDLWNREVKPSTEFIYRQATAKAERHVVNPKGWVMNPILNLQSINPRLFPQFRQYATKSFFASKNLSQIFSSLIGASPKIVQSMYFEGNSATWEHQDSYYLDSETIGEMTAAWIALEDIQAQAGRFFICPGSHKIQLDDHGLYNNIAENHESYIASVVTKIKELNLEIRAPILKKGDVLFWNAWTIHGSLDSQDEKYSRSSITCHVIPESRQLLQLQARLLNMPADVVGEMAICRPKDLALMKNRAILLIETRFPKLFYALKKQAILHHLKKKVTH
jgi:phytanoyl-CoA hydroxylase